MRDEQESQEARQRRENAKGTYCGCGACMGVAGECRGKCGDLSSDGIFVYRHSSRKTSDERPN